MKYIKKFERFRADGGSPQTAPAPVTKPNPTTEPTKKPTRPSPLRRDKPSVDPSPLAKATEDEVTDRFLELAQQKGVDIKKYIS